MGFVSTLVGILGFFIALPIGLVVGFFLFVYSKPDDVKEPVITPLQEFDTNSLLEILPDIPNWVKSPDYERVDWMNKFVLEMWPYLNTAICNTIRSMAKTIFADYIGKYQIKEIEFENLSLGTLPPILYGMKIYETNEKQLVMEPAIRWAGNPNVVLSVRLLSMKIWFQLVDVQIFVNPRIYLKPLVPTFPCFANIVVSLVGKPRVDFGLKVLGGDIMSILVFIALFSCLQKTIKKQVASLYHWPQSLEIPILDTSSVAVQKPVGILNVKVVRAIKLLKMDILGTSDPYVKLKLSGEKRPSRKTSIKMRNLNPEWNEDFKLIVKDPETQVLELKVYDWDKIGKHDKLGMQLIPLKQLTPHEMKQFTLDLLKSFDKNETHDKPRGQLVVELTYDPFKLESDSFKGSEELMRKQSSIERDLDDTSVTSEGGVLIVTIISAEDVEGEDHTNPYAQIILRGERKKTKTIKKNRNPRWDEHFSYMIDEPPLQEKLHVEVFSKHRTFGFMRKESLGFVDISLADVVHNGRINEKHNLINSKHGTIHLTLEWQTT